MQFVKPFEGKLWAAILAAVVCIAVGMIILKAISTREWPNFESVLGALYHSIAALLGGEDYEWIGWPLRVLRLGALFLTLLFVATYVRVCF